MARESLEDLEMDREIAETRIKDLAVPEKRALKALEELIEELDALQREERRDPKWILLQKRAEILRADLRSAVLASKAPYEKNLDEITKKIQIEKFGRTF